MDIGAPGKSDPHVEGIRTKKIVDEQVMSIIKTILERCEKEKNRNCLQVPLEDYYERVSFYTGLPKMFIYNISHENQYQNDNQNTNDSFDENDHILFMECINTFLLGNLYPQIKDLHEEFSRRRNNISNPKYSVSSRRTYDLKRFERIVYSLGYTYKKSIRGPPLILMEEPKIKFHRFNYLLKLKDYRQKKKKIYYVDERHLLQPPFKNPFNQNSIDKLSKQDIIFFHLISNEGYENGLFVSQECLGNLQESFKKWMLDIVLYTIKPGSVIVMANNSLHGSIVRKSITRYHSKKDMLQWLRENNIPCDPNMKKPRLYELIEKCTANNEDYDIDRVFKAHGHNVLRLPDYFPSLNPTKFLWDFINDKPLFFKNVEELRSVLLTFISDINDSMWADFFSRSRIIETQIFEIDKITEDLLENNCELDENCLDESTSKKVMMIL